MLAGTDPISGPSHKATWVATRPVAIRNSLLLSQAQTLRGGYPKGVSEALGFRPLDGKARTVCASFRRSLRCVTSVPLGWAPQTKRRPAEWASAWQSRSGCWSEGRRSCALPGAALRVVRLPFERTYIAVRRRTRVCGPRHRVWV